MSDTPIYDQLGAEPEVPNANFYLADNPDAPVPATPVNPPLADTSGQGDAPELPQETGAAETVIPTSEETPVSADPVLSYSVTIKTANPENLDNHSLVYTKWMTRDELLVWAGTLQA